MHEEILPARQKKLIPLLKTFTPEFFLVGGTAVALQLGHRESVDFDLFKFGEFDKDEILDRLYEDGHKVKVRIKKDRELTCFVDSIQMTFYNYRFNIEHNIKWQDIITMPNLVTLAAMKADALGGRAQWKDYVDLYYILKNHCSLEDIDKKAKDIFGDRYESKLFRTRLTYFFDMDFNQKIIFMKGFEVTPERVKDFFLNLIPR